MLSFGESAVWPAGENLQLAAPEGAISQEVGNYFYLNFLICFCSLGTIIANSYFHLGANYTSFNCKFKINNVYYFWCYKIGQKLNAFSRFRGNFVSANLNIGSLDIKKNMCFKCTNKLLRKSKKIQRWLLSSNANFNYLNY